MPTLQKQVKFYLEDSFPVGSTFIEYKSLESKGKKHIDNNKHPKMVIEHVWNDTNFH